MTKPVANAIRAILVALGTVGLLSCVHLASTHEYRHDLLVSMEEYVALARTSRQHQPKRVPISTIAELEGADDAFRLAKAKCLVVSQLENKIGLLCCLKPDHGGACYYMDESYQVHVAFSGVAGGQSPVLIRAPVSRDVRKN
jgi:hypothetical protein